MFARIGFVLLVVAILLVLGERPTAEESAEVACAEHRTRLAHYELATDLEGPLRPHEIALRDESRQHLDRWCE